jgi:hypothetical protein
VTSVGMPRTRGPVPGTVRHPRESTPPRGPGAVRRTTTVDTLHPDGHPHGDLHVVARGRDAVTRADGSLLVWDEAEVHGRLGRNRVVASVDGGPTELQQLVGVRCTSGFRGVLVDAVGELASSGRVLYQLVDDWPGSVLVAGQAEGDVSPSVSGPDLAHQLEIVSKNVDLCSGWAQGGGLLTSFYEQGTMHTSLGPPAPDLRLVDDPDACHATGGLLPGDSRRLRRLDLTPDADGVAYDVHFRDSWVDQDGLERVTHEYSLRGRYDPVEEVISTIRVTAHVLPWPECPGAAASATRVTGMRLDDLRAVVRRDFVGTTTCTHLNDVVRSLADLPVLGRRVEA